MHRQLTGLARSGASLDTSRCLSGARRGRNSAGDVGHAGECGWRTFQQRGEVFKQEPRACDVVERCVAGLLRFVLRCRRWVGFGLVVLATIFAVAKDGTRQAMRPDLETPFDSEA
jgi:hypothetical protein